MQMIEILHKKVVVDLKESFCRLEMDFCVESL